MAALCPQAQGIAAAVVSRGDDQQPIVDWTEYQALDDPGQRGPILDAWIKTHRLADTSVTTLLPIGTYNLLLIESPKVPAAELRAAVRWQVKDLIDFSIDDAVIDIVEVPPLKGGRDNMLYAVVARRSAVLSLVDELEGSDLALEVVDIPEFALRNVAALLPEDIGGLALIYLDDNAGVITITRHKKLFLSRRFDAGRDRLLASNPSEVTAEVEGLLDSIVIEVQRSLDYYESQFAQPPVQGIAIAPLGRDIAGLDNYLSSQLGIPARCLKLADLIDSRTPISPADEAHCIMAVGAALREAEVA